MKSLREADVASRLALLVTCGLLLLAPSEASAEDLPFPAVFEDVGGPVGDRGRSTIAGTVDDGRRTLRRLPANIGRGLVGVVHADNLGPFIVSGMATASASFFDQEVRDSVQQFDWGDDLETGAGPVWSTVFTAGMFAAGRFSHGRFRAMTYDMLDAAVVNLAYTSAIKQIVGRERPNRQDDKSFPSGHSSNAFALAAVAERHYGWKLGIPAYLAAGLVAASRVEQDKHYLSDVVAGSALGYIVGRTVVRLNSRPLPAGSRRRTAVSVSPIVSRHARGARFMVVF